MRMFMGAIVIALNIGGFAASVSAQEPALTAALGQLKDGESIGIRQADGSRTTGRLVGATSTLLTLKTKDGRSLTVPLDRVRRVWVADPASNGLLIGAAIGGASGAAIAAALCSIEDGSGSGCSAGTLLLVGVGAGAGAAIGGLGDKMHVRTVYAAGQDTGSDYASHVGARIGTDRADGNAPLSLGASWGTTHVESGLGFEVNVDNAFGTSNGIGPGFSTDMRVVYVFGKQRLQPFASGGAGYVTYGGANKGLAPVVGGGANVRVGRRWFLRPDVSFYGGHTSSHGGFRTGIGLAFSW